MALSSWQNYCQSSAGSRTSVAHPQLNTTDLGCNSACRLLSSTLTISLKRKVDAHFIVLMRSWEVGPISAAVTMCGLRSCQSLVVSAINTQLPKAGFDPRISHTAIKHVLVSPPLHIFSQSFSSPDCIHGHSGCFLDVYLTPSIFLCAHTTLIFR